MEATHLFVKIPVELSDVGPDVLVQGGYEVAQFALTVELLHVVVHLRKELKSNQSFLFIECTNYIHHEKLYLASTGSYVPPKLS